MEIGVNNKEKMTIVKIRRRENKKEIIYRVTISKFYLVYFVVLAVGMVIVTPIMGIFSHFLGINIFYSSFFVFGFLLLILPVVKVLTLWPSYYKTLFRGKKVGVKPITYFPLDTEYSFEK